MINNRKYSSKNKGKLTGRNRRIRSIRNMRQNSMSQNNNYKTRILHILKILYGHKREIFTLSEIFLSDSGECINRVIRIAYFLAQKIVEIVLFLTQEPK